MNNRDLGRLSRANRFFRNFTAVDRLLRAAASGTQANIDAVIKMVQAEPSLLLQTGNVVTLGGTEIINTTVYEFFLGSGHTEALAAMHRENLFALLEDGEAERAHQCEKYKPHIELLKEEVEAYVNAYKAAGNSAYNSKYSPTYDLRPLIDLIIESDPIDTSTEFSQCHEYRKNFNIKLRDEMHAFREAINESQRNRTGGMHYAHYTTLMQALDLLIEKWPVLSAQGTNYDKCRLVFSQIFVYLQRFLPARERFAFARGFHDSVLSLHCRYRPGDRFPDYNVCDFRQMARTKVGFSCGVFGKIDELALPGYCQGSGPSRLYSQRLVDHISRKTSEPSRLMHTSPTSEKTPSRCVLL